MRSEYRSRPSLARAIVPALGGLAGLALVWWFVDSQRADDGQEKRRTVQVKVLRPPPPPPPPAPEQRPPELPKLRDEVRIDRPEPVEQPQAQPEAPPPGPIGLDAQGTGPGDGFGLAARPGGRDITLGGGAAATGGAALGHSMFASGAARHIAQELARIDRLRAVEYRVEVRIWVGRDGRIERFEVADSTGDPTIDSLIRDGLSRMAALRSPVPEGLPQPLRVRVTSSDV